MGSAHAHLRFDGTGDIEVYGSVWDNAGFITLESSFTGQFIIPEGANLRNWNDTNINGGTLVLDGYTDAKQWGDQLFNVNDGGTLVGRGRLGVARSTYNFSFQANDGSLVSPGRVGETGTLTFENFDVNFNEGSTLRLDLFSPTDHDQLLFAKTGTNDDIHFVPDLLLATTGDGVTLQLNLLPDFSADLYDQFVILSGYNELNGTFSGLPDQGTVQEGDYLFQVTYGADETVLTVIPEPSSLLLLLVSGLGVFALRRHAVG